MTTYIPHTVGKVYDVAHLRPFDFGLAKQGHPLATIYGLEVRLFREMRSKDSAYDAQYAWDWFSIDSNAWLSNSEYGGYLDTDLCLAPLAIKHDPRTGKDEPLHVGDVIEELFDIGEGLKIVPQTISIDRFHPLDYWLWFIDMQDWRWPVEVAK